MEDMDTQLKRDEECYQILFNKPLWDSDDTYIYGFRIKVSEVKNYTEKLLFEYIVEHVFGKLLFKNIHRGSFEGKLDKIWII